MEVVEVGVTKPGFEKWVGPYTLAILWQPASRKLWKWFLMWRHISSLSCPSVFPPPSLGLYSCLDRGALGNPGDRRWGPQIEDPIVVQREMHCGWICPVLCKSNTLFTWTNTSCGVSPLLPCAAFSPNLSGFSSVPTYLRALADKASTLYCSASLPTRPVSAVVPRPSAFSLPPLFSFPGHRWSSLAKN